ncbi:MAG TPA: Sir2 silent information regulator family NAD-dependent deacetylase [Candidatus Limivivens merdigallinarum]|uniref:Sir2 silent information regulator family NAD-dependent deacetylase n=1 Tax=Candidatus Limivivens merdigallinarum TaxID=2840859 RepID=A0A9D0ZV92_9FIRM|nr:Sir2 silent information regulator family NAD-dependent deacetylase [Candidatus Limivivens merdigallinarum]
MLGWRIPKLANEPGQIEKLKEALETSDAVLVGAGAGLSASAGFSYAGERFERYFGDFAARYHFTDMYSGGFYPYDTLEEHWAYWSRYIYINRYLDAPKPVYEQLYGLVKEKDYFVLSTNVDHCFQKAGFEKHRLFYTQGDYGLFQCSEPCHQATYDNADVIRRMVKAQGYEILENGELGLPKGRETLRRIPSELVPHCPKCGKPMSMNLRADSTFVEDEGWHRASERYSDFLRRHRNVKVLFLELGVGFNTPGIIKYPFWQMTYQNPEATYACINYGDAAAPKEIAGRSICINGDIGEVLKKLK